MPRTPLGHTQHFDKPSRIHLIPALTIIVFIRRNIGGRILLIHWIVLMAAALYFIQTLSGRSVDDYWLRRFAVAFLILAIGHRIYYEVIRSRYGGVWHSYDRGQSWLSFLPLPNTLIHMIIDPALCGYLGWCLVGWLSPWLGFWIMIASGMLWATEFNDYRHSYHRDQDLLDNAVEGNKQNEAINARKRRMGMAEGEDGSPVVTRSRRTKGIWGLLRR